MQKPSKGRIVFVGVSATENNGEDIAPAVITRVWNDSMVNVKALLDSPVEKWKTSVTLFETEEQAREYGILGACFWPPRT